MVATQRLTPENARRIIESRGWKWFSRGAWNLNIVGVRSPERVANKFDDRLFVFCRDSNGTWLQWSWPITTDPGRHWLENPMVESGTAILAECQHLGCFAIGLHRGQYEALCQRRPVRVYRDGNRDDVLDLDPETVEEGIFGINIHRSNPYTESYLVDKWSAGCQVFKRAADFEEFMGLCRKARDRWGNRFTYTLLREEWLH